MGKREHSPSPAPPSTPSPLEDLQISDDSVLAQTAERTMCPNCAKTVKYFCYRCFEVYGVDRAALPTVHLPVPLDVIKHENELDGKSTAVHARILAPDDVQLYTHGNIPEYEHPERTLLLFPGPDAKTLSEIPRESFDRIVVVDGTWRQAQRITREAPQLKGMQQITIAPRKTTFWRFQDKGDTHLATIEAIYYTYREFADAYETDKPYHGQYDDLLFYYRFFYNVIQSKYKNNKRLKFNHRHKNTNYIQYNDKSEDEPSKMDENDAVDSDKPKNDAFHLDDGANENKQAVAQADDSAKDEDSHQ
ncbi:DTW domain-containing protein [Gongronella butleri]|nr:DTW domain-containing protein [Gongronella butleri]